MKRPSKPTPAAIGKLLEHASVKTLPASLEVKKRLCRQVVELQKSLTDLPAEPVEAAAAQVVQAYQSIIQASYPTIINGTGVLLHTGAGRAPLAFEAVQAMIDASGSCLLELDAETGGRGDRWKAIERKLCLLTGAEAALVVNNCASAVLLALHAIANRKEVVVSRGELVEIGGGFRMPDVMKSAGVKCVECGTTNRTRIADYRVAISPKTAALLKVHPSNYRISGFTESPASEELVALGAAHSIPVIEDLGNGLLMRLSDFGLPDEPTVFESVNAGFDLIAISGDKCLGGPQAGILLGKRDVIQRCRKDHLLRAVRPCKLTLAALDATLTLWLTNASHRIPFVQMLQTTTQQLKVRAKAMQQMLTGVNSSVVECDGWIGSGAIPQQPISDVALTVSYAGKSAAQVARALRKRHVLSVVDSDQVYLHLRSISPAQDLLLAQTLVTLFHG